jgi:hypothetical protein
MLASFSAGKAAVARTEKNLKAEKVNHSNDLWVGEI